MYRYCRAKPNTNKSRKAWKAYEEKSKTVLKIAASYHSLAGLIFPKLKSPPGSILQLIQRSLADILGGMIRLFYKETIILSISHLLFFGKDVV